MFSKLKLGEKRAWGWERRGCGGTGGRLDYLSSAARPRTACWAACGLSGAPPRATRPRNRRAGLASPAARAWAAPAAWWTTGCRGRPRPRGSGPTPPAGARFRRARPGETARPLSAARQPGRSAAVTDQPFPGLTLESGRNVAGRRRRTGTPIRTNRADTRGGPGKGSEGSEGQHGGCLRPARRPRRPCHLHRPHRPRRPRRPCPVSHPGRPRCPRRPHRSCSARRPHRPR